MADKECTACGWDGTLTRLPCPTCKIENWYCSDCHAVGKAFNCGECQVLNRIDNSMAGLAIELEGIEY